MLPLTSCRRRRWRAVRRAAGATHNADGEKGLPYVLLLFQRFLFNLLAVGTVGRRPPSVSVAHTTHTLAAWMAPIRSRSPVRSSPPPKARTTSRPVPRALPTPLLHSSLRSPQRCRTAGSPSPCTDTEPRAIIQQEEEADDTDQGKVDQPLRRRQVLAGLLIGGATVASSPCNAITVAAGWDDLDASDCRDGALSSETAIPGAYQQACMTAPVRRLPVRIPGGGGDRSTQRPNDSSDDDVDVFHLEFEQDGGAVGAGSTGLAVWNGSVVLQRLLEYLVQCDASLFHDKTVVELGCGVGVGSLTCAALGASRVIATDGNPHALLLAQRNIDRNHLGSIVTTQQLPWGWLDAQDLTERADVVIASDLTYSPGSWRALAETMAVLLAPTGYVLYVSLGHPGFPVGAEVDGFLSVAASQGLISLTPDDTRWPFPKTTAASDDDDDVKSLDDAVLRHCLRSPTERAIVLGGTTGGGVRVVVLAHRPRQRLSTLRQ